MARNIPAGDSIELFFAMPSTRIATATTFVVEATYLGTNKVVPATHLFYGINEENLQSISNGRFNVRGGARHFYVCVRVNADDVTPGIDRIQVKVTPQNNKDWFKDESYIAAGVIANRHVDSALSMPLTNSTEEGKWGEIEAKIEPPLEKPANFNVKITHITTNSTALDGLQVSTDGGTTWTNTLNNINFLLPVGNKGFKIKYFIKENLVEEGNRYFDITTLETTPIKVIKPIVNVKTRVTVIDTTKLNYGDLISTYCNGRDLYGIYSDGQGGRYEEPIILNAPTCGAVILPPDTLLQTFCAGTTRVQHLADGSGGYYRKVVAYNSEQCGYTPRPENPNKVVTPTMLNKDRKGSSVLLNTDNDVFGALLRDNGISLHSTRYGKWYFEVQIYLPTTGHLEVGLGFGTNATNMSEWIGANNQSYSWWPYDSTKYHNDRQGIYAQTIDVVDKDIIGVQLDMDNRRFGFSINGVWQGWCYEDILDEKMHFFIAGRFDSWAWVNFGKYAFKYQVPQDYFSGFGAAPNPPPEKGTIISYFCVEVDQWKRIADGRGGYTTAVHKVNAVECGWIDPKPPEGTIIGFVCDGFDKFNKIADGDGGFTLRLAQINSPECGWTPPDEGSLSNVRINNAASIMDPANILSGDRMSYNNLTGSLVADWAQYSGIWYWELNDWTGSQYVGMQHRDSWHYSYQLIDNLGIYIEPLTGMVGIYGVKEQMFQPVAEGTPIGFKIDFLAQTLTAYVGTESKVLLTKLNYPSPIKANRLVPSVQAKVSGTGTGTFNFGQQDFHYPFAGSKPYQKPAVPFQQRGTVISYKCDHWTRYVSRADGAGGSFTELFEVNSAPCGWYPDPPIGTILGYYCKGWERWKTVANGNYTTIDVLVDPRSTDCGYVPAGTIISYFCVEKDQWAKVSDGEGGSTDQLIRVNSPNCGYVDGDNDFSDQEPHDKFNIKHERALPVTTYDIIHKRPLTFEAGELLSRACVGVDSCEIYADGNGGTTQVITARSTLECGFIPPPPPDRIPVVWDNVALLLHGDSVTKESSKYKRNITNTGVTIEQNVFTTGPGLKFNGGPSTFMVIPGDANLNIGDKAFAFEIRIKVASLDSSSRCFYTSRATEHGDTYSTIFISNEGLMLVFGKQPGEYTNIQWRWVDNEAFPYGTEAVIVIQRDEIGLLTAYLNGKRMKTYRVAGPGTNPSYGGTTNVPYINKSNMGSTGRDFGIGRGTTSAFFDGRMGELRLTIGQQRFLLDEYEVDTTPFPEN